MTNENPSIKTENGKVPGYKDQCTMKWYTGTLVDKSKPANLDIPNGAIIKKRPAELIPGWAEALQRMKEGAIFEVYIPPFLGFRHRSGDMGIPTDAVFVITFELYKVSVSLLGGDVERIDDCMCICFSG